MAKFSHLVWKFKVRGRRAGYLDGVVRRIVCGWVQDRRHPDRSLDVQILIDGKVVGLVRAAHVREDLQARRIGDGGYGFRFPLPIHIKPPFKVEAIIDGTDVPLPAKDGEYHLEPAWRPLPDGWKDTSRFRQPSLFVIGAAKSGTTSLHAFLDSHPDIAMSDPKEPFFFGAEYELGPEHYYNAYFSNWAGERIAGESRHRNLYLPYVPDRIHSYNPEAKLVVILRNPVNRAISHWWHWYSRGRDPLTLSAALEEDLNRIESGNRMERQDEIDRYRDSMDLDGQGIYRTYLDSGYYADQLERYLHLFPKEQIHVIVFEDLKQRPKESLLNLLKFLECDPSKAPSLGLPRLNEAPPGLGVHVADHHRIWLREHYAPHNRRLEELLGRRLVAWV